MFDLFFQGEAQEHLQQHPALVLHLHLPLPISFLLPALLPPFTWHPTPLMWAAGRASYAISTSQNTRPVPGATWRPSKATQA